MRESLVVALAALMLPACGGKKQQPMSQTRQDQQSPQTMVQSTVPDFHGGEAFAFLTHQTSFGPRNPNSVGHRLCLEYLSTTLRSFTDAVRLEEFTQRGYDGETLRLTNIIASFKPQDQPRILLCAHWDTRPRAEHDATKSLRNQPILGANDGASGVAVLLELASLMKLHPPPVGVDIALFDGEDYGMEGDNDNYLLGSRYFAAHKAPDYVPRFGILLDMVGDANLEIPKEENSVRFAPDIVSLVWKTAFELGVSQFADEEGDAIIDDHLPLNESGIKTIDLIDFNYPDQSNKYWHTHQDTPEHCSAESLEAVGRVVTHVVYAERP